ncbi:MAG: Coenzyme F420 hydrogenase/dehydrogenase, beta subunit C-terminal domain [Promethearchaeota archaeon]
MEQPDESPAEQTYRVSFDFIKKKLEGGKDSFGKLMREVVRSGVCTHCSACVSICPVIVWDEEKHQPKLDPKLGKCTGCGACYHQCPRTITTERALLGDFLNAYVARAGPDHPEIKGQDGGVVTAFLTYLLDEKLIDGAVVTRKSKENPWWPEATIAKTRSDLLEASGSIYCHSQTVEKLLEAIRKGIGSVAFVGTPCNIDAVDKMQKSPVGMLKYFMRSHVLKVGIFCMDSFSPEALYGAFERDGVDINRARKMDISKGKFNIYYEDEEPVKQYTIKELDKYKSSSCNFCVDLTSENADISIGSVGAPAGWNAVLTRTSLAQELFDDAVAKGYIELRDKGPAMGGLKFLAKLKKVSQYNVKVRTTYIVQAAGKKEESIPGAEPVPTSPFSSRRLLTEKTSLINGNDTAKIELTNQAGWTLENLRIRVARVQEMFEDPNSIWYVHIAEIFPYEVVNVEYPLKLKEDEPPFTGDIFVEISDITGKIFSKKISIEKLLPKEE